MQFFKMNKKMAQKNENEDIATMSRIDSPEIVSVDVQVEQFEGNKQMKGKFLGAPFGFLPEIILAAFATGLCKINLIT